MMIDSAVKEFPALTSLPGWETEKNMLWFFCFLASSFLFSSGVLLFKNQNISALQRAKKILLVFLAISFLYHLWILVLFGVDQASFDFVIDGLAKSCAYTIIWYAYLSKSKNIKNVYC